MRCLPCACPCPSTLRDPSLKALTQSCSGARLLTMTPSNHLKIVPIVSNECTQSVTSLIEEQTGAEGRKYFLLVLTAFLFLLSSRNTVVSVQRMLMHGTSVRCADMTLL